MRFYIMLALLAIGTSTLADNGIPKAVTESAKRTFGEDVRVFPFPIKGLYEVVDGGDIFYLSKDGRYLVVGNIYDLKTRTSLTNERRAQLRQEQNPLRMEAMSSVKDSETVVFAPENGSQYTINVFTDVSCGYCVKLHKEVPKLNKGGVKVRYLAFPRAGVNSQTYKDMVSVWCAKDKQQAMTDAKLNRKIEPATCNNPVADQYELGQSIGITGTPAMVLSDGELLPGYVPAKKLIKLLQEKSSQEK